MHASCDLKPVEVRSSPLHGRGLFAAAPIQQGTLIATYPILVLSTEDAARVKQTRLYHYVFHVDETEDGGVRTAVAFGDISMCNHSQDANASFLLDAGAQTIALKAVRDILPDEEILIDYEDFANEAI